MPDLHSRRALGLVEVRLHGRGGHGTVVASKMLARAAMLEGRSVQCFPEFGVERRGAPVTAYLRVDDRPIRRRSKVYRPDHLLVMEEALLPLANPGPGSDGVLLVNAVDGPGGLSVPEGWRTATVDATGIARRRGLARGAIPVLNSPMAAAFARTTGLAGLASIVTAVREYAPARTEENVAAAEEAWEAVVSAPAWSVEALQRSLGFEA